MKTDEIDAKRPAVDGVTKGVETEELTKREIEVITTVFKSFETGLREATILPRVSLDSTVSN